MPDLEQATIDKELVAIALQQLPERAARILRLRYGLDGESPYIYAELGEEFGISRERTRQIEVTAIRQIRRHFQRIGVMPWEAAARRRVDEIPALVKVMDDARPLSASRPQWWGWEQWTVPRRRMTWWQIYVVLIQRHQWLSLTVDIPWTFAPHRLTHWPGTQVGCWHVSMGRCRPRGRTTWRTTWTESTQSPAA